MRRSLAIVTLIVVAAISVPAQQAAPPGGEQQPPVTFKVEVNYVEIDAVVTDARGNFVRDLTKEDFEVIEEGKPQEVSAFSLVDLPVTRPDAPLFKDTEIEPDVRSNRGQFNGRVIVLVLDNLHTAPLRSSRVKQAARQFVERYVGANDLVAVAQTGLAEGGTQELTGNRARLLRAIDRFVGQKLPSTAIEQPSPRSGMRDGSSMERSARARNSLETLKNLAEYLAPIRGRRKAIVWFGEGVDYEGENPLNTDSATRDMMLEAIASATRAGVSFYGVDARGLGAGLDEMIDISGMPDPSTPGVGPGALFDEVRRSQNSLRTISTETGGFAIVNQTDMRAAFARIVQENSSYYVLGYHSSDERRDGKFRTVDVRVKKPGLEVRARKGYTAPKGRATTPPAAPAAGASAAIREALNSPLPATGLTMSVYAAPFAGKAPKASLALVAEFDPGQLKFVQKDGVFSEDLELVMIAVDSKGKLQDGGRDEAPLRLSQKSHDAVATSGLRLTRRLEVPPGRYQIRVGARESTGAAVGAVTLDVDVPDFAKLPLAMSGIALTSPSASRMVTANPDPEFKEVLPASPTSQRDFPRSDVLSLFVDVYDNQRTPHRVAIQTTVTADNGTIVFTASDERSSDELKGARGGGYGHKATIPLKTLEPGRYVLAVRARTLLSDGATASREVEFRVR